MSENTQEVENTPNGNDENDLAAQLEQLKSTNERLLAESKKHKTRMSEVEEMRQKLEAYEQEKLEQKGNYQEMLERERQKARELEQKMRQKDDMILQSNVFNSVANYAKDAHDINDLLAQKDYAKLIEVDEDSLQPTPDSVKKFVDSLKNDKKYLFKGQKVASMADAKPSTESPRTKTLAQMTDTERKEALKSSLSQLPSR
jgi:vacuolar-type H+-ATPase subunit I/STV1